MASAIIDNRTNPAVRCVTSSKLPVCDDAKLPINEVIGLADVVSTTIVAQNSLTRIAFDGINPITANGCQWDAATDEFVIQYAGNYELSYDLTANTNGSSTGANVFVAINATAGAGLAGDPAVPARYAGQHVVPLAIVTFANFSGSRPVPLVAGDRVGVYAAEDNNVGTMQFLPQGELSIRALIGNYQ